jgi:outer membrane protein TolC
MKSKQMLLHLLLTGLLLSLSAFSQESLTFSLPEAQEYAAIHSYVVRNSELDVTKAKKKVWETIAMGLPQLSGSAGYTKNIDPAKSPMPVAIIPKEYWPYLGIPDDTPATGTYPISFSQKYNSDWGISVSQLIFDGSYIVGVGSAQIYLQMAKQTREKTEIDIRNTVAQSYYMVLIARENLKVMQENLANSQKLLSDAKAMFENGFVEEQDVEQMQLLVKNGENQVLKSEREIRISKIVLKFAMGVDMDSEIELADNLDTYLMPLVRKEKIPAGFDYSLHIDYRMLVTEKQISEKLLNLEKVAYLPTLSGFYNWTKMAYGDNSNLFKNDVSWFKSSLIGLNVSIPIFNGGMKNAKVKQARIELEKADNNQKLAEQNLQKNYLSAVADFENAVAQYTNNEENKELAKKIYDKTTVKYNNGISGSTELAQNESQYIQTQSAYIQSVMQVLNAKVNLNKALGKY